MTRWLLVRLAQVPIVLLATYSLTFVMVVAVPGNPFQRGGTRTLSPVVVDALKQRYGMQDNWTFYWRYLAGLCRGDLGQSIQYPNWTCNEIIAASLPVSATVGLVAVAFALGGGVVLGSASALRPRGPLDRVASLLAVIGASLPAFVVASGLLVLFSSIWHLLPVGRWGRPSDVLRPALALSFLPLAYVTRLTRTTLLEVLSADFIRTARAKGLSPAAVLTRHALPHALLPVVQYLAPACAAALTGSFVVERVFNVPGLGVHFVNAILNRDQMLILATVMVYATLLVLLNTAADLLVALIDPRVAAAERS